MKEKIVLLVIIAIAALAPHASAADQFQIFVYDSDRNLVDGAYVEVWDGSIKADDGKTENGGVFDTWLERSIRYRIAAKRDNQEGEWNGFPENSEIHIYMHIKVNA